MWFARKHAGGPAVCTAISGRLAIVERSFVRQADTDSAEAVDSWNSHTEKKEEL